MSRRPALFLLITSTFLVSPAQAAVRLITGDANGQLHDADAFLLDLSGDGNRVLFTSGPPVVGQTPGIPTGGLYLRDLAAGTLRLLVAEPSAETDLSGIVEASLSDDGRYVAWHTSKLNVYWKDTVTGESRLLTPGAEGTSRTPKLSADGRYVAFVSVARNLVTDTALLPAANRAAVYLYDSQTGATTVASLTHDGRGLSTGVGLAAPSLEFDFSADGQWVVFSTDAAGVHPDRAQVSNPAFYWLYRRNVQTGQVDIVSRNAAGAVPVGNFVTPRVDGTGNRILFGGGFVGLGGGPTLVDGYSAVFGTDLYAKDMATGQVWRVSATTDGSAGDGVFAANSVALSRDGRVAAFVSSGTKHVPEVTDPPGSVTTDPFDVFRCDLVDDGTVALTLVSKPVVGNENVGYFSGPLLPGDGRYVAFVSRNAQPLIGVGEVSSIWNHGYAVGEVDSGGGGGGGGYAEWAAGLPEGTAGLLDVPFGDGITNLRKYVHGLPAAPYGGGGLPAPVLLQGGEIGIEGDVRSYLVVDVPVRGNLPEGFGVNVGVGSRVDLPPQEWVILEPSGSVSAGGGVTRLRFVHPVPAGDPGGTGFVRISVFGP